MKEKGQGEHEVAVPGDVTHLGDRESSTGSGAETGPQPSDSEESPGGREAKQAAPALEAAPAQGDTAAPANDEPSDHAARDAVASHAPADPWDALVWAGARWLETDAAARRVTPPDEEREKEQRRQELRDWFQRQVLEKVLVGTVVALLIAVLGLTSSVVLEDYKRSGNASVEATKALATARVQAAQDAWSYLEGVQFEVEILYDARLQDDDGLVRDLRIDGHFLRGFGRRGSLIWSDDFRDFHGGLPLMPAATADALIAFEQALRRRAWDLYNDPTSAQQPPTGVLSPEGWMEAALGAQAVEKRRSALTALRSYLESVTEQPDPVFALE